MTKLIRKAQHGMFWNPPSSWGLDLDDESDLQEYDSSISTPVQGDFLYTDIAELFNKDNPIDFSSLLSFANPDGSINTNLSIYGTAEPRNKSNNIFSGESTELPPGGSGISGKKLAEGKYPYANTTPYKGISTYDLRKLTRHPIIDYDLYEQLLNDHSGKLVTFDLVPNNAKTSINKNTAGGRNNNPCNISFSSDSIGVTGRSTMGDGQQAAVFNTAEDGIASAMRLYRRKYGMKNIPLMNNGLQGYYKRSEPIGLSALRLDYVTKKCKLLGISPSDRLNTDDKWTLCSFVAFMAKNETGSTLSRETLDKAYKKAFGE